MKHIWFDITNTPQVHFLYAIYKTIKTKHSFEFSFTARDFSETTSLLNKKNDISYKIIGRHYGKSMPRKVLGLFKRFKDISISKVNYDISISCGSESAIWTSYLRRKKSIAFGDNDQARQWTYGKFVDFAFFPDAISRNVLNKQGLSNKKLFLYPGYKEDIYIADYIPDSLFKNTIPFNNYVVVRPENVMANYLKNKSITSITPELLKLISSKGINILYLPRYSFDHEYAKGINNIFIPENPINGLDACYYSDAVFTGAGTFAREAACLGIPSFSFYAGSDLLAVDKKLISENRIFFSRDPSELLKKMIMSNRNFDNLSRSKMVRDTTVSKLMEMLI